jgi:dolichyl-diphosphooligosaccharide--protein glycosyltransferase
MQNIIEKGRPSSDIIDGMIHDDLVVATPIDPTSVKNIHLALGVFSYRVAHFFSKNIPLSETLFYVPIFLSLIVAIFSFTTAKSLGADDLGAFFASVVINLSPFFLERCIGEWFDTDMYNILFPLLIFGIFLKAFGSSKKIFRFLLAALAGLFLAFYASTWKGWWFIFDFILFASGLFILNEKLCQEESGVTNDVFKDQGMTLGLFFILGSLFVILINGFSTWKDFIAEPMHLATILKVTAQTVWPNVYLTVAELNAVSPAGLVAMLGGPFFFYLSMLGTIYVLFVQKGGRDVRFGCGILVLVFWILGSFYAATIALRFVLLLVVPLGLAFGLTVTKIYELINKQKNPRVVSCVRLAVTGFFSLFLFFQTMQIYPRVKDILPSMDDPWYSTLTTIKNKTSPDAMINSWWDYGHWFKAIAQRRVLFDGMTQNTPTAYWMANILLTSDEAEAAGILRMINTSGNKSIEFLEKNGYSTGGAVKVIRKAVALDKKASLSYLKQCVPEEKALELLNILFPDKVPPIYFIMSPDMIIKIGPISFIGNWDFDRVEMWFRKKEMNKTDLVTYLIKKYNQTLAQAETNYLEMSFLNDRDYKKWLSKPRAFFSNVSRGKKDGNLIFFDSNGLVVNMDNFHARLMSEYSDRRGVPSNLFLFENGKYKEEDSQKDGLFVSALVFKSDEEYNSLLLDKALAKSMMVRLYFLKGEGLKYFKLWHKETVPGGSTIYVYELQGFSSVGQEKLEEKGSQDPDSAKNIKRKKSSKDTTKNK